MRSQRTNGFVERMDRTLLDECFRVAGRTTWYLELAEVHLDRSRQGYRLRGPDTGAGIAGSTGRRAAAAAQYPSRVIRVRQGLGMQLSDVDLLR